MYEQYIRALTTEEALRALQDAPQPIRILAGGTDVLLQRQHGGAAAYKSLLDISNIEELTGIKETVDGLWIGAATKLAAIETSNLITKLCPILAEGAREVGSPQIRNLATLGGNICNASPSADTAPALLVLNAIVLLLSQRGERKIPLATFFKGPGISVMDDDEIMTAVLIPRQSTNARGMYIKLKAREVLDLAFVGVSVLVVNSGEQLDLRIALGAVAPTPIRATRSEKILKKAKVLNPSVIQLAAQAACDEISPISDVRASAEYRQEMVKNLTAKALIQVLTQEDDN